MNLHNTEKKSYYVGFLLSMLLTFIPFYIIHCNIFNKDISLIIIISCAIIQIYVHLIYFLHLGHMPHMKWNIISLVFTIFIIFILVLGSMWIMTHLHHNLMT